MQARVVLEDCEWAYQLVERAETEQDFRIYWVALVSLLRAVGHVLDKVDRKESDAMDKTISRLWKQWSEHKHAYPLFWRFIEDERNSVLKEYKIGIQSGDINILVKDGFESAVFNLGCYLHKPLIDGPFAGEDGRDIAREAIDWWTEQLNEIEKTVSNDL